MRYDPPTRPNAEPTANIAATNPCDGAIRSAGKSSATIARARGNIARPTPWSPRAAIKRPSAFARSIPAAAARTGESGARATAAA
jgi:hypothetical protein